MAVRPFCITFNFGLITYIITITTSKQISRPKLWLFLTSAISQQFHKTCETKQALPNCSGTLSRCQAPTNVSSTCLGNYGNFQDFSFVQSILALKLFKSPVTFSDCFSIYDDLPIFYSQAHIIINPVPYLLCLWISQYNTLIAPFYSRQLKNIQYFIINNTNLKAPQILK